MATHPASRSAASNRSNSSLIASARVSFSRNSQIVRASGTRSDRLEKPHERQAVVDQKLAPLVGEGVRRLNHQDPEHHHRVERRPAALRTVRVGQRPRQLGPEHLEIDRRREGQQLIAQIAQPPQALVDVEKPRLTAHRLTPLHHQRRN